MLNVMETTRGTVFGSTSVHPSETNGQSLGNDGAPTAMRPSIDDRETSPPRFSANRAQAAYHARYQKVREHILNSLDDSTFGPIGRQRTRIANCCLSPLLVLTDDGHVKAAPGVCRQRMCPTCQARRGRELTARVAAIAGVFNAPRFVTLTLAASTDSLKHQLDRLYAWFRELRRAPFWKDHVTAAVAVAEVTRNPSTGHWHPHLHVLTDGTFMPQAALSAEWARVTGGSMIVDIRAVHDRRNAAQYVAAYVAKPAQVDGWPADAVNEFAWALHGRRMLITAGLAHKTRIPEDECETKPAIAEPLCSLPRLLAAVRRGCLAAVHAFSLLQRARIVPAATFRRRIGAGPRCAPPLEHWEREWLIDALRFVGTDHSAEDADACPFPDAATIAATPPQARPGACSPPSSSRTTVRVSTHTTPDSTDAG